MSSDFIESRLIDQLRNKAISILPKQAFLPKVQNEEAVGDFVKNLLTDVSPFIDDIESYPEIKDIVIVHLSEAVLTKPSIISDIAMILRPIIRCKAMDLKAEHYLEVGLTHKGFRLKQPEIFKRQEDDFWLHSWTLPHVHSFYEYKD